MGAADWRPALEMASRLLRGNRNGRLLPIRIQSVVFIRLAA